MKHNLLILVLCAVTLMQPLTTHAQPPMGWMTWNLYQDRINVTIQPPTLAVSPTRNLVGPTLKEC